MKSNLTKKLILYFTTVLLVFAVIIGALFTILFANNMKAHNRTDLEKRANTIANTLSGFLEEGSLSSGGQGKGHGNSQGQGGFGVFLKLADNIAMGEVWLVDSNTNLITKGEHSTSVTYDSIPLDGEQLIQSALNGETGYSDSFSEFVGEKSMTVCVPVYNSNKSILGAVLLHAPVESVQDSIWNGLRILLISTAMALLLSGIMAVLLSKRFIYPIKKMHHSTQKLADGDYNQETYIRQNDEIGELAIAIDELSQRLLVAKTQQEQLEKERQEFYADISHELRTPVTVMRGSLETLRDGKVKDPDKQQEYYNELISESAYIQDMVNDLLDFSKLKNPDFKLEISTINLSDILSDAARSMRRIAADKNVQIVYSNSFPVIEIQGNYEKIRQMILIILDNAVKFSPENETVIITVKKENHAYHVHIRDYGPGITKENMPYIFDRFYKEKSEKNKGGTGIGLAIAKQIADRHEISIAADSENIDGTIFSLTISCR